MHSLLDAVLTLLEYFGLLCGVILAAGLALVGSYAALSSYIAGRKRRRAAARALRDWADVAFPAVEWDREKQCYLTKAERARQPKPVVVPPAPALAVISPGSATVGKEPTVSPPAAPPLQRRPKHGFERRY